VTGVLEGGALVSAHIGTVPHHGTGFRMEIYGRDGTIRVTSSGAPQRDANQLMAAKAGAVMAILPVPARLTEVPADTPIGPPRNVGHLYLRMAGAIRTGAGVEPDFDLAVRRHQLIDAIERSSDEKRSIALKY
jgi:predicted dehydrogenase